MLARRTRHPSCAQSNPSAFDTSPGRGEAAADGEWWLADGEALDAGGWGHAVGHEVGYLLHLGFMGLNGPAHVFSFSFFQLLKLQINTNALKFENIQHHKTLQIMNYFLVIFIDFFIF
jgi:hypothetical protein